MGPVYLFVLLLNSFVRLVFCDFLGLNLAYLVTLLSQIFIERLELVYLIGSSKNFEPQINNFRKLKKLTNVSIITLVLSIYRNKVLVCSVQYFVCLAQYPFPSKPCWKSILYAVLPTDLLHII